MEGYSICFNEWALDKDIKNELGLLCIISSLCAKDGYCYATNEFFAGLFDTTIVSISRKIKLLEDKNYITIDYKRRGCEILERKIRLTKMTIDDYQKCYSTINKNVKENNTIPPDNNIIINNNILSAPQREARFQKPTVEEVEAHIKEKGYDFDAESFVAYYDSNGWMVGKKPMKNWKAACITWQRNGYSKKEEKQTEFYW